MLEIICEKAIIEGQKINLEDCRYCEASPNPPSYYYFLAGLVRSLHLTHILELGTYFGGSIIAMSKGIRKEDASSACLVTVDNILRNSVVFRKFPYIKRIQGDVLDKKVIEEALRSFDRSIDILFIDAVHEYDYVKKNIFEYGLKAKPRFIILEDIYYNNSMRKLWGELVRQFKDNILDITQIVKRDEKVGFGIIEFGNNYKWNCRIGVDLKVCSARIKIRKFASSMLPEHFKKLIKKY